MIPELYQIGVVRSAPGEPNTMPIGGTNAIIEIDPKYERALLRIAEHSHLWILTWFHKAERDKFSVVPARINPDLPEYGVFGVRAYVRPNPIGLSRVKLEKVEGTTLHVSGCDAIDGTPVLDIKSYYEGDCVFSPRAPYIRPASREMRWSLMLEQAVDHHQEMCDHLMVAARMALAAEEIVGMLSAPGLVVHVDGPLCAADAIQGITRARIANPRRLYFNESDGPVVTVWETLTHRVTITDRQSGLSYGLEVPDADLFSVETETLG